MYSVRTSFVHMYICMNNQHVRLGLRTDCFCFLMHTCVHTYVHMFVHEFHISVTFLDLGLCSVETLRAKQCVVFVLITEVRIVFCHRVM